MNCRERFLAALNGETTDRPPLAQVAALTPVELQQQTGCYMPEAHLDPESLVRLCGANHEVLGFDAVTFIINFFNEPAALGVEMKWGSKASLPMYASHPWSDRDDATAPKDLLDRVPLKTNLEALRIAKQRYGDRIAVLGKVMGPFSMTQVMYGVENTMLGLFDEPDKLEYFMDVCIDILVENGNAQLDLGIEALLIGEGGAGAKMLSPKMYEEHLQGVHKRMIEAIQGPTIMHICGDITPRLNALAETGLTCFNFDWAIDPAVMKRASAGKFTLMGNVNTADLWRAPPEVIERQVVECLEAGVEIISPGCAVSPECPVANFHAMRRAIDNWLGPG